MKSFLSALVFIASLPVFAQTLPVHGPSDQQLEQMEQHNRAQARRERQLGPVGTRSGDDVLPFAEYQKTGFIVFSDDDYFGVAEEMKQAIAQNLPEGVTLLIYTESTDKSYQKKLFNQYSQYISSDRLKVLQVPESGSNNFWSRDNLPLPVWNQGKLELVDARYYYNFEPDSFFRDLFQVNMTKHNYFYEGGNFIANAKGDCIVVNRKKNYPGGTSDTGAIPDTIFKTQYGCKTLTRLKHLKGIGHADEVVKFMNDDTIITDESSYVAILQKAGFNVIELPEADLNYETYINSLQVNDMVFVPVFGEKNDQKVIEAYEKLGLKVVTINTRDLATQGQGGIHCITMNYPNVTVEAFVQAVNGIVVQ